jgi:hypothetical protein
MTFREEEHPRREDGEFVIRGGWRGIARSMSPEQRTVVANHLDAMLSNPGHGATPDTVDQLRQLRKADVNRFIAHAARFLRVDPHQIVGDTVLAPTPGRHFATMRLPR